MTNTDYEHIWGASRKEWCSVDFKEKQVSSALLVLTWMGMLSFFVFAIFSMVTRSDWAAVLMIASLLIWVGCGIAIIRIRRTHRKMVAFDG